MSILCARDLTKRFGATEAIAHFDLDVPEGAVFALVGPNGAGKTTALKTALNILRPSGGRAEVLGVGSTRLGVSEWARIGYVSEGQDLPEWMTVAALFAYCKPFYPEWSDDVARGLAKALDLPLDRRLDTLSRGTRIKAALASSLAYHPRLLVLDEPFNGLDVLSRDQLIATILGHAPGTTVIIASQDVAEIETCASHVAFLDQGRVRFAEEMQTLLDRFREVEVTLDQPADLPAPWPASWLHPETGPTVVRFTDSRFGDESAATIRGLFPGAHEITPRPLPLRSIVVAEAKRRRA